MNTRIMTIGILLIIGATTMYYLTQNVVSQLDFVAWRLPGSVDCESVNGIPPRQSQIFSSQNILSLNYNICSTLNNLKTVLEMGPLAGGLIGMGIIIFGGLTRQKNVRETFHKHSGFF